MVVCKFYQSGNCKFGNDCRFEHPGANQSNNRSQNQPRNQPRNNFNTFSQPQSNQSNQNQIRQQAPSNFNGNFSRNASGSNRGGSQRGGRGGGFSGGGNPRNERLPDPHEVFGITKKMLDEDLALERPMWLMSCYGPGKNPPVQMWGGEPLEQSPEEIRCLHYLAVLEGNPQASAQLEAEAATQANQQVDTVRNDYNGAIRYVFAGRNEHPNRVDICNEINSKSRLGLFTVQNQRSRRGVFRDSEWPPRQQQHSSGFGGQPQEFGGQPQGFGGQPSGFGGQPSGFGGQPSGFGGQPAGFGEQPSGLGGQPSGFGGQPSGFGGGFGQQQAAQPSMFGQQPQQEPQQQQQQLFGQSPPQAPPFGQQQQQQPQFDQQTPGFSAPGAFGQPQQSAFGGQQAGGPGFGQQQDSPVSPFTMQQPQQNQQPAFGQAAPPSNFGIGMAPQSQQVPAFGQTGGVGVLQNGNAQAPVNGAEIAVNTEGMTEAQAAYAYMRQTGQFKDGIMPETAPKMEWIQ